MPAMGYPRWPGAWQVLLSLLVLLQACGAANDAEEGGDRADEGAVVLAGSSSSFAAEAYYRWFNQLTVRHNVAAELSVLSSSAGIRAFLSGVPSFAGTDVAPSDREIAQAPKGLLAFPVTAGAIAIAYNLPGCDLRLSRAQLVGIYRGTIRDFGALGCAAQPITVMVRSDSSGTTANLTASLAAFSTAWRQGPGVGRQVRWPVGVGVSGTASLAERISQQRGAVGAVESAYVRAPLQAAALQSRQGAYLRPDPATAAPALATFHLNQRLLGRDPDPAAGYPLVSLHWLLAPERELGERLPALRTSLRYILSEAGQDDAERLGYIPLPEAVRARSRRQIQRLAR